MLVVNAGRLTLTRRHASRFRTETQPCAICEVLREAVLLDKSLLLQRQVLVDQMSQSRDDHFFHPRFLEMRRDGLPDLFLLLRIDLFQNLCSVTNTIVQWYPAQENAQGTPLSLARYADSWL